MLCMQTASVFLVKRKFEFAAATPIWNNEMLSNRMKCLFRHQALVQQNKDNAWKSSTLKKDNSV